MQILWYMQSASYFKIQISIKILNSMSLKYASYSFHLFVLRLRCFAGKRTFFWAGPAPRLVIMNPEMVKEVLNNNFKYPKPKPHPIYKIFIQGLASTSSEGSKWTKRRRLLNPAFHTENLKVNV